MKVPFHFEYMVIFQSIILNLCPINGLHTIYEVDTILGTTLAVGEVNGLDTRLKVGFEDAKELSYLTLACPLLKYN